MSVEVAQDRLTYEQWRLLPESNLPQEVIDGVLQMAPAPSSGHQWTAQNLYDLISPFVRTHKLGLVLLAPVDLVIRKSPLRTRQPDLLFLNSERTGLRRGSDLDQMPVIEVVPDLVVEILSESDTRSRMEGKLEDYRSLGVRECWLVSREAQTVEVLDLTGAAPERVLLAGRGDLLSSTVLPGWSAPVDAVFE